MVNDTIVWGEAKRATEFSNSLSDGLPESSDSSSSVDESNSKFKNARLLVDVISKNPVTSSSCDHTEY